MDTREQLNELSDNIGIAGMLVVLHPECLEVMPMEVLADFVKNIHNAAIKQGLAEVTVPTETIAAMTLLMAELGNFQRVGRSLAEKQKITKWTHDMTRASFSSLARAVCTSAGMPEGHSCEDMTLQDFKKALDGVPVGSQLLAWAILMIGKTFAGLQIEHPAERRSTDTDTHNGFRVHTDN